MAPTKATNNNNKKLNKVSKIKPKQGRARAINTNAEFMSNSKQIIDKGPTKIQKKKKKQKKTKVLRGIRHANEVKKPKQKHKWSEVRGEQKLKKATTTLTMTETADGDTKSKSDDVNQSKQNLKFSKKLAKSPNPKSAPKESLRERMKKRLEAARFRQINEELDSTTNSNPVEAFQSDPDLFKQYHEAYKGRIEKWPSNPLDVIIRWIKKKLPKDKIIADFGCGEARLSLSVPNKVHSFDLFALNDRVTACDMSAVPLEDDSVDAAIFCLSLMGTDVSAFIVEANRVLKLNGILKIAEVASRFAGNSFVAFLKRMKKFGFAVTQKGQKSSSGDDDDVFLMFEFMKIRTMKNLGKRPTIKLSPSVYKKR